MPDITYVDNNTSAANRVTAAWLNMVNRLANDLSSTATALVGPALVGFRADRAYTTGVGKAIRDRGICITDAPWNAVPDGDGVGGGTNNYAAITAALAYITASGLPGSIYFPSNIGTGIYRCDAGLAIDVSLHSLISHGARLDFHNLSISDFALTLNTATYLVGTGSFFAARNYIEGLWFSGVGPSTPPTVCNGVRVDGTVSSVVTGYQIRNCVFTYFTKAVSLTATSNSQAIRFSKNTFLLNDTAVYLPLPTGGAAGSAYLFEDNFFAIGFTGFDLRNPAADIVIRGGNIDGMNVNFIYHLAGSLTMEGVHIETGTDAEVVIYNAPSGVAGYANVRSYLNMTGGIIIAKGTRTAPVFNLSKAGSWNISGGFLNTGGATHSVPIIDSDASGEGIGVLCINGLALDKVPADTVLGLASTITISDTWGEAKGLGAGDNSALNQGTSTVTPTSLTVTGVPTYSLTWSRSGDRCKCTLQILANGGTTASTANTTYFTGLPYLPAESASGGLISSTTTGGGQVRISTDSPAGRVYTPSWAADALNRTVSFEYRISR